jgi:hypothetical protein
LISAQEAYQSTESWKKNFNEEDFNKEVEGYIEKINRLNRDVVKLGK